MLGIGIITSLISDIAGDWKSKRADKRKLNAAVTENKIRLASSKQSHNQNWEMAQLEGKDDLLRRVSFVLLSFPIVWAFVDPVKVEAVFNTALAAIPDWYQYMYVAMIGAIWGISELRKFKR